MLLHVTGCDVCYGLSLYVVAPRPVDNDSIDYIELKVNSFFENYQNIENAFFLQKGSKGQMQANLISLHEGLNKNIFVLRTPKY